MTKVPDADTSGKGVAVTPKMAEELPSWVPGTEQQKVFWDTGKVRVEARCAKGVWPTLPVQGCAQCLRRAREKWFLGPLPGLQGH